MHAGDLIREWRQRRRLSQLDLAIAANVSSRHLSFVETGRSRPTSEMILHLAEHLDVPLRDRNARLLPVAPAIGLDEAFLARWSAAQRKLAEIWSAERVDIDHGAARIDVEVRRGEERVPVAHRRVARDLIPHEIALEVPRRAPEHRRHAAERVRVPEFRFYVVGIGLQNRTGGSLTDTLANLSHVIRRRKELRLKIRAFTAESKMSVMVLSALPFIAGGLQLLINYDLMVTLFTDPRGRFMVGLALASLVSGTAVMAYIIKRAMR